MLNDVINQFVVKQDSGQQWYFFYEKNSGICFKKKSQNIWSNYEVLFKDGQPDFDVISDRQNNIHIICQDKSGNIIYLIFIKKQWQKFTILQSKTTTPYLKHFKILHINGRINAFYTIASQDKYLLIHHILDNNKQNPTVIDYISTTSQHFCVENDSLNNIYIYYLSDSSKQIVYKTYLWSKKEWEDFSTITNSSNCMQANFIIDNKDNIHLTFLRKTSDENYDIIYMRKLSQDFSQAKWDNEIIIHNTNNQKIIPTIFHVDKKLWLLWQENLKMFSSNSIDNGTSWSSPSQFISKIYDHARLFCLRIANNNDLICNSCYGYNNNNNDIHIYILSDYINKNITNHMLNENPSPKDTQYQYTPVGSDVEEFAGIEPVKTPEKNNIEFTKLKIMINIMQEELAQMKNKFIEFEKLSNIDEQLKNYMEEHYGAEINSLKTEVNALRSEVTTLKSETQQFIDQFN